MTLKLILYGLKERLKVYAGIVLLYLLYAVVSNASEPTPRMDNILDWFRWSYEVLGVKIYAMTFVLLGMAAAALVVAEIIIFVRDFYSPQAYLLFSLPVNGKHVIGSRLGLFILDFLFLVAVDLPFRLPFYRTLISSVTSGEIGSWTPWLTTSDLLNIGILAGITWILIFTIVPLLTYLLIAVAKSLFDLSAGWLTAFVALGVGVFSGLCYLIASVMPPLVQMPSGMPPQVQIPSGITTYNANLFIPVLLLILNVLIFWSGAMVIDRKLNI
jgi:ABC-2 type transport system permease protein